MPRSTPTDAFALITQARADQPNAALEESMTLQEYLNMVLADPSVCRRAHTRLFDMIMSHGTETFTEFGRKHTRFLFFSDPFDGRDALYGADIDLERVMVKLRSAATGGAASKRILLLHGPVGSAKSTIARLFKKGLAAYSRTDAGRAYTFKWKRTKHLTAAAYDGIFGKGVQELPAPMFHDPFSLIDEDNRKTFATAVEATGNGKVEFRGDLDPLSQLVYTRLLTLLKGDWTKVMDHVEVTRMYLNESRRIGIGTFQPKDEKNQDATELTGSLNYRKIAIYGSDSDPRAFNFDGEFQIANRGLIEFVELLKLDTAFLYDLLTASEEGMIKPKKFAQCSVDTVILGHNNEPELKKLEADEYMEALRNRTIAMEIRYVTKQPAEAKIYERDSMDRGVHIAPHTFDMAALFAVASRLDEPKGGAATVMQKVKLYSGEHVDGFTDETVKEMRKAGKREGMDRGISPRTIQDIFDNVITKNHGRGCVNPFNLFSDAERTLARLPLGSADERERLLALLKLTEEEYKELAQTDVQRAIAADPTQAQEVYERYVAAISAYISKEKIKNPTTGRDEEPDERFMSAIEEKVDVHTANKQDYRQQFMSWIGQQMLKGITVDYTTNDRMRKAIERYLFDKQKDTIHLSTLVTPGAISVETQEKIEVVKKRLIDDHGYCSCCANDVLSYVASVFARGESK